MCALLQFSFVRWPDTVFVICMSRTVHLDTLIKISGVVTRRSGVFPQLQQVKYDCVKCGTILGPFFQNTQTEIKVGSCPECQSKGPFTVNVEQVICLLQRRMLMFFQNLFVIPSVHHALN